MTEAMRSHDSNKCVNNLPPSGERQIIREPYPALVPSQDHPPLLKDGTRSFPFYGVRNKTVIGLRLSGEREGKRIFLDCLMPIFTTCLISQ